MKTNVQVKICGITNLEDALWAAKYGADYVGLNFCAESPRKVSIEKAKEVALGLPPFIKTVGVFVNPEISALKKIIAAVPLHAIQLHGDESVESVEDIRNQLQLPVWKAFRIENENSLEKIPDFLKNVQNILIDSFSNAQYGGTGESFDWNLAIKAKEYGAPVFLAGGLRPENVKEAVKKVAPKGVDAASGVEKEGHPRKKDIEKMNLFIQRAKGFLP